MTLAEKMAAIVAALGTACPTRTVTRDMKDFADRSSSELTAGVLTLVSLGEGGYRNYNGREAMDGRHRMLLVGQVAVSEVSDPSDVEDAEFALVEEVKAFVRALPPGLCSLSMTGFRQSGQAEAPYGWVSIDLEMED
jgi:hypothetical protein